MRASNKPPGVHLPRHLTWEQVRADPNVPVVMTNTRRMAKSIAAQGHVACVVTVASERELAAWLSRQGAVVTVLPEDGLPM
jgi:hypothetical protein